MSRNAFAQCEREYNEAEERREQAKAERAEIVSRANACVRACAGIANPGDYEFARVLKLADEQRTACLKYEQQRDELLAALKAVIDGCEHKTIMGISGWHRKQMPRDAALDKARSAIANIKEKKV